MTPFSFVNPYLAIAVLTSTALLYVVLNRLLQQAHWRFFEPRLKKLLQQTDRTILVKDTELVKQNEKLQRALAAVLKARPIVKPYSAEEKEALQLLHEADPDFVLPLDNTPVKEVV